MTTTQQDSADVSLHETFDKFKLLNDRLREQTFDQIKSLETKVKVSERNNERSYEEITKLEALVAEKDSKLEAVRSDFKNHRDTSQQLIGKLQKEIVDVTAQKKKYKERLDEFTSFSQSFTESFTPDKPEAKALAENGSDDAEEQPVGGIAASFVASPPADRHAVLDTSLQINHFNNSGEEEVENEPLALKESEEVAGDEGSEEDTSSPLASLSKKSDEDVLQDDSDKTASPKKSDDEGEELHENEPVDVEKEEDEEVEEEEDGKNDEESKMDDTGPPPKLLLTIAENEQLPADEARLDNPIDKTTPLQSEDEAEYETASEGMGEVTTRDAGSQTPPPPSRKTRSSSSVKRVAKSPNLVFVKKQKRSVRRSQ